jgi:hypothetical protein
MSESAPKIVLANKDQNIVIIKTVGGKPDLNVSTEFLKMMIKIAACLLAVAFLAACQTTKTTTKRETIREMKTRYASASTLNEPAPPAEGPEDVPADRPLDPTQNPALVPSPLLRANAIGSP